MYTEQQKKEYQKMRRDRKADQQATKNYLRSGRPIHNDDLLRRLENGDTKPGKCFLGGIVCKSALKRKLNRAKEARDIALREAILKQHKAINITTYKKLKPENKNKYYFYSPISAYIAH